MKSDTRHTIIDTAAELFYRNGYNLTGINEIIKESGIAKATLYSHFPSKEELFVAYLDKKDEALLVNFRAFTNNRPKGDDRIRAVLEFLIPFFQQEDFNGCWCIRTVAEVPRENEKIRGKIRANKNKFRELLRAIVRENKPELEPAPQEVLTNQLYLLYEGALSESHLQAAAWPIETAISLLDDILSRQ